jgi:hypothetical protein
MALKYAPEIPVTLSMKTITGLVPINAPMMLNASTQYAMVEFSKSKVTGSRKPVNFAIEYSIPVVSLGMSELKIIMNRYRDRDEHTQNINIEEGDQSIPDLPIAVRAMS